jgi:hypothetical protein
MPLCCEAKQGAWGGRISKRGNIVDFNVTKILDISQKIIPVLFFFFFLRKTKKKVIFEKNPHASTHAWA